MNISFLRNEARGELALLAKLLIVLETTCQRSSSNQWKSYHPNLSFSWAQQVEFDMQSLIRAIVPEELLPSLIQQLDSQPLVCTLALWGNATRAQSLSDELARKFPGDTMHNSVWLPLVSATLELRISSCCGRRRMLNCPF
jgi:hypothetical protein